MENNLPIAAILISKVRLSPQSIRLLQELNEGSAFLQLCQETHETHQALARFFSAETYDEEFKGLLFAQLPYEEARQCYSVIARQIFNNRYFSEKISLVYEKAIQRLVSDQPTQIRRDEGEWFNIASIFCGAYGLQPRVFVLNEAIRGMPSFLQLLSYTGKLGVLTQASKNSLFMNILGPLQFAQGFPANFPFTILIEHSLKLHSEQNQYPANEIAQANLFANPISADLLDRFSGICQISRDIMTICYCLNLPERENPKSNLTYLISHIIKQVATQSVLKFVQDNSADSHLLLSPTQISAICKGIREAGSYIQMNKENFDSAANLFKAFYLPAKTAVSPEQSPSEASSAAAITNQPSTTVALPNEISVHILDWMIKQTPFIHGKQHETKEEAVVAKIVFDVLGKNDLTALSMFTRADDYMQKAGRLFSVRAGFDKSMTH